MQANIRMRRARIDRLLLPWFPFILCLDLKGLWVPLRVLLVYGEAISMSSGAFPCSMAWYVRDDKFNAAM